ncbi:MAG: UvrD-helicase domain-containing protein, partial [Acetatifactor sp.]|nr:UvrD-helicase domain-containing protein [Acetatifactor sp.]
MEILGQLNPRQREAVLDESSTCVVNANVGSGKTTVLIAKLLYLFYIKKIRYSQMIVLTFTHKAAQEIRRRLESWEGSIPPEG